jgi:hypothetical protein
MDLQAAKHLNSGMWLFAKVGVLICFGLAGVFLASSLWGPRTIRAESSGHPSVQVGSATLTLPKG